MRAAQRGDPHVLENHVNTLAKSGTACARPRVICSLLMKCFGKRIRTPDFLPTALLREARDFVVQQKFRNTFAGKPGSVSPDKQRAA